MKHPKTLPSLVFADKEGNISDFPPLAMAGMSNGQFPQPALDDLIPLPEGSDLFVLPGRLPVGSDRNNGEPLLVEENPFDPGKGIQAVAAFMAPAHTILLNSAYKKGKGNAPLLPLFAYAAVGWADGTFWVSGFRSDMDSRQDAAQFDQKLLEKKTKKKLRLYKNNRLVQHLGKCCLTYCCPAARNYFLDRWEAPLPTSPQCNARCLGCISLQPSGCCPSTQDRITFVPSPSEISEIAIDHLDTADKAIVSFGQGCEGEPLLQAKTIEQAIRKIRATTDKGTINLNSNSSLPDWVKRLATCGLDSIRVSLNSAQEKYYQAYYRPVNYCFSDVKQSIKEMKDADKFVSLNYFIQPGLTDSAAEFDAFSKLIEKCKPDFIQLRNLNMDPEWYLDSLKLQPENETMGMKNWYHEVKRNFPHLRFGYFNPPLR